MGAIADMSGGLGAVNLAPPTLTPAAVLPKPGESGGHGVGGFLGNLLTDFKGMALGAGKTLFAIPHDTLQVVSNLADAAIPGHADFLSGGYWTADVVKGLASLPSAYAHNYGSGWHNFGKYVYEHPLGFVTDAATVASLGGGASAKAATVAADAGQITKLATEASRAAELGDVNLAASKATEAGALADAAPEWTKRILPGLRSSTAEGLRFPGGVKYSVGFDQGQLRLLPEEAARNPLTRSIGREAIIHRLTTIPIGTAEGLSSDLSQKLGLNYPSIVEHARSLGLTRVDRPRFAEWQVKKIGRQFAGLQEESYYAQRKAMYAGPEATARAIASLKDKKLAAETMTILDADLQGLAVSIDRRPAEVLQPVAAPGIPKGQSAMALLDPAPVVPLRQRALDWNIPEVTRPYEAVPADNVMASQRRAEMQAVVSGDIIDSKVTDGEIVHTVDLPAWSDVPLNLERLGKQGQVVGLRNTFTNPSPELGRGIYAKVQLPDGTVENYSLQTAEGRRIHEAVQAGEKAAASLTDPVRQAQAQAHLNSYEEPIALQFEQQVMGKEPSLVDTERERLRGWNIVTNELPMYEQGWTPDLLFDSAYLPLRQASGAKFNFEAKAFEGGQDAMSIHKARQDAGLPTPVYFPKYDVRSLPRAAHLFSRRPAGLRAMAHPAFEKRNTGHLFEQGLYLRDPVEALKRRAAAGLRQREAFLFVRNAVNEGARPMAHANDWVPGAEYVFSPDLIEKHFTAQLALDDEIARRLHVGEDPRKVLSETVRDLALKNQKDITAAFGLDPATMRPLDAKAPVPKMYAMPRKYAEEIMSYTAPRFGKKAKLFVEKPQDVWRSFTLHGSPRWIINNVLGNVAPLSLQGASILNVLKSMDRSWRDAVDQVMPESARFGFTKSVDRKTHLGYAADTFAGTVAEAIGSSRVVRGFRKVGDFSAAINQAGENAYRRASYLKGLDHARIRAGLTKTSHSFWTSKQALAKLAGEGVSPEIANTALKEMEHFFGDYKAMTPFEKNVIRPYFAPFWGFYRHMARLTLAMPFEMPARAKVLQMLGEVSQEMNAQYGPMPDWMQGAMVYGQDPNGTVHFLTTGGVNPFQSVQQLLDPSQLPGMLSPIPKTALEQITGHDVFGNEFSDPNVYQPPFSSAKFKIVDGQPVPLSQTDVFGRDFSAPGLLESILRNFPQYQAAESVAAGGAAYGTSTLPTLLAGQLSGSHAGVLTDAGQVKYPQSSVAPVLSWAGLPQHEMDLRSWQQKQAEAALYALQQYRRANP